MGLNIRSLGKKLTDFGSKAYDQVNVFDNNRTYQQRTPTQNKSVFQQAGQVGGQTVRGTVGGTARVLNTIAAQVPQVYYTAKGDTRMAEIANQNFGKTGGLFNVGTLYSADEARRGDFKTGVKRIGLGTAEAQLEALTLGRSGLIAKPLIEQGLKKGLQSQAPNIITNAGLNTAQGAVSAINQDASAKDVLKSAAIGGTVGTAADLGLGLGAAGIAKISTPKPVYANFDPNLKPKVSMKTTEAEQFAKDVRAKQVADGQEVATLAERSNPSDAAYRMAQDTREAQYNQTITQKAGNATKRELIDPRQTQQRLDNAEFKRQKAAGLTQKGQKELMPEQSLAVQRGKIEAAARISEVRNKKKYATSDGEQLSINDLIKIYGKDSSKKARDFEQYRIYKDELERIGRGGQPSLGLDPNQMARYANDYEVVNPRAAEHNAVLRQSSLEGLAARRDARIDTPETYEKGAGYQYYNPRQALDPEDLIRPEMSGGIRSGAKGTQARGQTAGGVVRSPLGLFRKNNENLERSLAEQQYGLELRRRANEGTIPGAREVVDADVVVKHKSLLNKQKEIAQLITDAKRLRDLVNDGRVKTKAAAQKQAKVAKAVEDKIVLKMRELLHKAEGNPEDVLNDLVERDPRFATEAATIKAQKFPNLTKKEAADQIKYDLKQLDRKYPKPAGPTREELLGLADVIGKYDEKLAKSSGEVNTKAQVAQSLQSEYEDLTGMLNQARQNVSDLNDASKSNYGDVRATTQNLERGTQTYSYKVDGETGKIEIPNDLATELSKANELQNLSMGERGLRTVATAQKLFWTNPVFQPAFKVWNTLVKNPLLAYRNADGLSGIRPEAVGSIVRQVFNTKKMQQFKRDVSARGAAYENAMQSKNYFSTTADDIAARAGLIQFFNRNPISTLGDLWKGLNTGLAWTDNAQRTAVAYGAYKRAKGLGYSESQALDLAAQAPAKVFGDFDRVSRLAQNAEALIPYTGAIQAGARALGRATKTKPFQTTFKDATLLASMAGLTAYSLGNAEEYYQDMIDQGKEYLLDSNWTIALPGAHKNADGKWDGVFHIPLTPDLRPLNRATWQSVRDKNVNVPGAAGEIFNMFTGDTVWSLYDNKKVKEGNVINGILPMSPAANAGKTLAGINIYNGKPLAEGFTASRPRVEQVSSNTSDNAKNLSKFTNGLLTPQQFDQIFNQMGSSGDIIQETDKPGFSPILKPLRPGVSQTDKKKAGSAFYKDLDVVGKSITDEKTYNTFKALHTKDEGAKSLDKQAEKYKQYLAQPSLLAAEKKLNDLAVQRGNAGNPLFNLSPEQQQKVMRYRGAKDLNAAKQAYDKNGNPLFTALGLDEQWYDDFRNKENAFYDKIKGTSEEDSPLSYSGATKPKASSELQAKLDKYYGLTKGTGDRSAFLKANPDVLAYWDKSNQFTDAERVAMGLKTSDALPNGNDGFASGSGGSGGDNNYGSLNPLKYAVSLNAGGSIAKPKVSVKKAGAAPNKKASKKAAPKVTLKKSLV